MRTRTQLVAAAAALVVGAGTALTFGSTAQAEPTTPPGPAAKSVTVCVTGPDGTPFTWNRVTAVSRDKGVYRLANTTQTRSVAGGCGELAVGSTGTVKLRAAHITKKKLRRHLCTYTTYRAQWPLMDAASIVDGTSYNGMLHQVSKTVKRCR